MSEIVGEDGLTLKVLGGHSYSGAETHIEMVVDGMTFAIWGKATNIIRLGGPEIVELLHKNASPECEALAEDTPERFYAAIKRLVTEKKEFYTVLRHGWSVPAVLWSTAVQIPESELARRRHQQAISTMAIPQF